jgi:hypothetical protein
VGQLRKCGREQDILTPMWNILTEIMALSTLAEFTTNRRIRIPTMKVSIAYHWDIQLTV